MIYYAFIQFQNMVLSLMGIEIKWKNTDYQGFIAESE